MSYLKQKTIITPAQLTSDQTDYAPTDWYGAEVVCLSSDSNIRGIKSFAATLDGDMKCLVNVGSYPLYISGEHTSGTAANRVIAIEDVFIYPNESVIIIYDGTSSRWRITHNNLDAFSNSSYSGLIFRHYSGGTTSTTGDQYLWSTSVSGTGAVVTTNLGTSTNNAPSSLVLSTGSTNTGISLLYYSKTFTTPGYFTKSHAAYETIWSVPILSDVTESYVVVHSVTGTPNNNSTDLNRSVGFKYSDSVDSGNIQCFAIDSSAGTTTINSGIAVAANTLYKCRVEINKMCSEARYYINNTFIGKITTNLPDANSLGARSLMKKLAGTTNRNLEIYNRTLKLVY